MSSGRKFEVHGGAIPWPPLWNHQAGILEPVKCRRDRRDRRPQRLSDPAHVPFFRPAYHHKQANVIGVKVSIGTPSDDAGLELVQLENRRHSLIESQGLTVTAGVVAASDRLHFHDYTRAFSSCR